MKDSQATFFCAPVIEKHFLLVYSIINEVHLHSPIAKHPGIETVLKYAMQTAYIIEGR